MATPDIADDLERALDAIESSYEGPLAINNLESAALPNRRAVIDAYTRIASTIYLGFYAQRPLSRSNLREALAEQVRPAYEKLAEHIHRAVTYEARYLHKPRPENFTHEATMQIFRCLPTLRELLNDDAMAAFENDLAARSVEEVIFSYPTLAAITAHRVAHMLYRQGVPLIPRIISEHAHSQTGIDIHPGARIGRRFFIDHGTGVVVGETTEIGDDVKLYQGVTLGALSTHRAGGEDEGSAKRHPTIEDDVTIYAHATILGGETRIGRGSIIGGNVWLVRSVPPYSKLFGRRREEQGEESS
ncbi:MAG TPA: serine O-acetyltransferase EpsC [Polyangiaceae bacterium]|nr:serine O-acetyltransferase EpsC [Polyangiaceae bacterium]